MNAAGFKRKLVRVFLGDVSFTPEEAQEHEKKLRESIKHLCARLKECREERDRWQARAYSAENVVQHKVKVALRDALQEHDKAFSTNLQGGLW